MSAKKKQEDKYWMKQFDTSKMTEKEIRNAEKYGNPRKLGFLRFLMICFISQPIYLVMAAFLVTKEDIVVDLALLNGIIDGILYTVIFVMIWQRKKATRLLGIIIASIDIGITILDYIVDTSFGVSSYATSDFIISTAFNVFLLLYFIFSRRVKYALNQPLSSSFKFGNVEIDKNYFKPKTWAFWRDLIILFFIFSVVGHWMEYGYCWLIRLGIIPGTVDLNNQIWSDFLFPFPIYGAGAVTCALIFYPIKRALQKKIKSKIVVLILVFVLSGVICTLMELAMGLATNADLRLWDYTNMFCNFMGQVCLQNSLCFALAATIMTYVVYPAMKNLFTRIEPAMNWVFAGVVVFGTLLFVFYYFNYLPEQIKNMDPTAYKDKISYR